MKTIIFLMLMICSAASGQTISGAWIGPQGTNLVINITGLSWITTNGFTNLAGTGGATNLANLWGTANIPSTTQPAVWYKTIGFNSSGAQIIIATNSYLTREQRQPYPNVAMANVSADSIIGLDFSFALSQTVFTCDSNLTAILPANLISNSTGGTYTVTNLSTVTYPVSVANWVWPPMWYQVTNTTAYFELDVFHRSWQNGQTFALVRLTAADQHSHTATINITNMSISELGIDAHPTARAIGAMNWSSFTPGDYVRVDFRIYPQVGDTNSLVDTASNLYTLPLYQSLTNLYDPNATNYGQLHAYVDPTNGVTHGTITTAALWNGGLTAKPYLTVDQAVKDASVTNGAIYGHADAGGFQCLMTNGSYTVFGAAVAGSLTNSRSWCYVGVLPGVSPSSVVFIGQSGDAALGSTKVWFGTEYWNSSTSIIVFNIPWLVFQPQQFNCPGAAPIDCSALQYEYWYGVEFINYLGGLKNFSGGTPRIPLLVNGCSGMTSGVELYHVTGCAFSNSLVAANLFFDTGMATLQTLPQGEILYNTTVYNWTNNTAILNIGNTNSIGVAIVQCLGEWALTNQNSPLMTMWIGCPNPGSYNNIIQGYNTWVGARIDEGYDSYTSSTPYNLLTVSDCIESGSWNINCDSTVGNPCSEPQASFQVGDWGYNQGVDQKGIACYPVTNIGAAGDFVHDWPGINTIPTNQFKLAGPELSTTNTNVWGFKRMSAFSGITLNTPGAGNGDYTILQGSQLNYLGLKWTGLPIDINGNPRVPTPTSPPGIMAIGDPYWQGTTAGF